jgi:hypothetical protein
MVSKDKKENLIFEIDLGRMTFNEGLAYPDTFEEYKTMIVVLSQIKDWYLSEEEVLDTYELESIEKLIEQYPNIVKTNTHWKNENGVYEVKYIDIRLPYNIQPSDPYYDMFFIRRLRQFDLLEMDAFLDYHFENYYNNVISDFSRFLKISLRKHGITFLNPEIIQTVQEWIENKEKQVAVSQNHIQQTLESLKNQPEKGRKNRAMREPDDKKTCLNQEQTVLLMHYLQQAKVFLRDEDMYKTEFGKAFEILTGYSQHSLRQDLSGAANNKNKINLKELDNLLTRLQIAVVNDLKQK